jgi:hypothetical protein
MLSASGAAKSNAGLTTFYIVKNATLAGTPSFTQHATDSVFYVDKSATTCTFNDSQVVWSSTVSESGQFLFAFTDDIELQPGERFTLCVRSVTQTATCVGGLNFREDQ